MSKLMSEQDHLIKNLFSIKVRLLGRSITCMTVSEMIKVIDEACRNNSKLTIGSYNVHSFNLSMIYPWFYNFFENIEIAMCDSIGIMRAIEFMGVKLPIQYRVTYTMLIPQLLDHCDQQGFSVFLLGAAQDHLDAALSNMAQRYPTMQIDGHHGFFPMNDPYQNEAVIERINAARPNVLIVGMGNPRQEEWVYQYGDRLNANVIMLGGAVIKRLGGITSDCPTWLSNMGLEWFLRLCQEPRRLGVRYLIGNPVFVLQVILAKYFSSSLQIEPITSIQGRPMNPPQNYRSFRQHPQA